MILSHIIFSHGAPQLWMPFIPSTGWENIPRVTEIQFKIIFSKSIFIYIAIFCTSEMQHRVLDRDKKKKKISILHRKLLTPWLTPCFFNWMLKFLTYNKLAPSHQAPGHGSLGHPKAVC